MSKIDTYTIAAIRNLICITENREWKRGNTQVICKDGVIEVLVKGQAIAVISPEFLTLDTQGTKTKTVLNRINAILRAMYMDHLSINSKWQWNNELNPCIQADFNGPWYLERTEF